MADMHTDINKIAANLGVENLVEFFQTADDLDQNETATVRYIDLYFALVEAWKRGREAEFQNQDDEDEVYELTNFGRETIGVNCGDDTPYDVTTDGPDVR